MLVFFQCRRVRSVESEVVEKLGAYTTDIYRTDDVRRQKVVGNNFSHLRLVAQRVLYFFRVNVSRSPPHQRIQDIFVTGSHKRFQVVVVGLLAKIHKPI